MDINGLGQKLADAFSHFPQDTASCSGVVSVSQPAPVVAGSGTGGYAGITGGFTLTVTIAEVDAHPPCTPSSAFLAQSVIISATGTVSLG